MDIMLHSKVKLGILFNVHLFFTAILFAILLKSGKMQGYEIKNQFQNVSLVGKNKNETKVIQPKLVCFYVFTHKFKPQIMEGLCTHLIVGFFRIDKHNYSIVTTQKNLQQLSDIVSLKKTSPELKILISVGGASSDEFGLMAHNHTTRKKFIRSVIYFIKKYKVDGLDIDWEWPAIEGDTREKIRFIQLLHEIKKEFKRHRKKYLLCADVSANRAVIEIVYYAQYIADNVDFVNVMCYDYRLYTDILPLTGHNSPLYVSDVDKGTILSNLNINYSIPYWLSKSMPKDKIVVGLPTYGHTYKLSFPDEVALNSPSCGPGALGNSGFADYQQICKFLKQDNVTIVYDHSSKVPYAYKFPEWVSYDNEMSLAEKAEYILKEGLSGAMIFSVNADDYSGTCSDTRVKLPLIKKIRSILLNEV